MRPLISLIPAPDRSVEPRKPLTKRQRAEMALAQGGRCGCGCGVKLDHPGEGTIDEHLNPLGLTGTNDLSNRSIWRKPCSDKKTREQDVPAIAEAKRREARDTGTRRPRKAIPSRPNAWPKGRKLPTKASRNAGDKLARYDDGVAGGMNPNEGADQ